MFMMRTDDWVSSLDVMVCSASSRGTALLLVVFLEMQWISIRHGMVQSICPERGDEDRHDGRFFFW